MKLNIDKTVLNFLIDFGLTEKEITVYMTLLKTGPNTIMNLARETGIKRSTTHNTVEELIKKGLVSQTNYGERRMVIAEDPEKLSFLMDQKKWDITKLEKNLPDAIKNIIALVPNAKENSTVNVKYYEGNSQVQYVYNLILKSDSIYSFVNVNKTSQVFPNNVDLFRKALKSNSKLNIYEIIQDNRSTKDTDNDLHERYKFKFVPEDTSLSDFDFIVFDDNVAMIHVEETKPMAVVIQSDAMANGLKSIHQLVWSLL